MARIIRLYLSPPLPPPSPPPHCVPACAVSAPNLRAGRQGGGGRLGHRRGVDPSQVVPLRGASSSCGPAAEPACPAPDAARVSRYSQAGREEECIVAGVQHDDGLLGLLDGRYRLSVPPQVRLGGPCVVEPRRPHEKAARAGVGVGRLLGHALPSVGLSVHAQDRVRAPLAPGCGLERLDVDLEPLGFGIGGAKVRGHGKLGPSCRGGAGTPAQHLRVFLDRLAAPRRGRIQAPSLHVERSGNERIGQVGRPASRSAHPKVGRRKPAPPDPPAKRVRSRRRIHAFDEQPVRGRHGAAPADQSRVQPERGGAGVDKERLSHGAEAQCHRRAVERGKVCPEHHAVVRPPVALKQPDLVDRRWAVVVSGRHAGRAARRIIKASTRCEVGEGAGGRPSPGRPAGLHLEGGRIAQDCPVVRQGGRLPAPARGARPARVARCRRVYGPAAFLPRQGSPRRQPQSSPIDTVPSQ